MKIRTVFILIIGVLTMSLICFAQTLVDNSERTSDFKDTSIVVGPGDLLDIAVFDTPELSGKFRVSERGEATLPLIGALHLAGLSPEQAQQLIQQRLREGDFVKEPQVTLLIAEYATQGITILGEVNKPGIYPAFGEKSLFDLISLASGFTPTAGNVVTITHHNTSQPAVNLALRDANGDITTSNVKLLPGDTVVLQRAGIVYVVGDVGKPGGFIIDHDRMSVMQALALAQGVNRTASRKGAKIVHKDAAGMSETPIDLQKIMAARTPDPDLRAGDIVFVPGSTAKTAMKRGIEAVLQTAVGVTIYSSRR